MWQWVLKKKIRRYKRWLLNIATIFSFLIAIVSVSFFIYQVVYAEKIYGGVFIGPYSMAGKTQLDAEKFLQEKMDDFLSSDFEFYAPEKNLSIEPMVISPSGPEFSYSLVSFNIAGTTSEAFRTGRSGDTVKDILTTVGLIFRRKIVSVDFKLSEEILLEILKENFEPLENPPQNVRMKLTFKNSSQKPYIEIIPERNGRVFNFNQTIEKVEENIKTFKHQPIRMSLDGVIPEIKSSEINGVLQGLDKTFEKTPITLKYQNQKWDIDRTDLASMVIFKKDENGRVTLGLDDVLAEKIDRIAEEIDIKPTSAKFVMESERVVEFQISEEGQILDKELSVQKIEEFIFSGESVEDKNIELVVRETTPLVTTESVNTMGIKEAVGAGESNFAWSPTNRRHNIDVGSKKLHGLIIAPGEEFSLNTALGRVNAKAGYKPELVIKGNKTVPEYGGGLCQIATTMFRAALNAGLEITARQNHSYRVSYYEPPVGTDATIYQPNPDLKFKNNTGHSLLIQTEINGDDLIYTLWGTDDGREVVMGAPVIWATTIPPAAKLIETLDLAPGVKKCTERAHNGASVYFDYEVNFPDGEVLEKRFTSLYRPWQEVCLIGVKKLTVATSTTAIAE
ncbi:MAG: VanW family protein [Parcubacteria group bacterium]|nr:VanW family protein [Parcubacteria group bacterium]